MAPAFKICLGGEKEEGEKVHERQIVDNRQGGLQVFSRLSRKKRCSVFWFQVYSCLLF